MNFESIPDEWPPTALELFAEESHRAERASQIHLNEIELYLAEERPDATDRELLRLDYATTNFTLLVQRVSHTYRLLELLQDSMTEADNEQLYDQQLAARVKTMLSAQATAITEGVDVNMILERYDLSQYRA